MEHPEEVQAKAEENEVEDPNEIKTRRRSSLFEPGTPTDPDEKRTKTAYSHALRQEADEWRRLLSEKASLIKQVNGQPSFVNEDILTEEQRRYLNEGSDLIEKVLTGSGSFEEIAQLYLERKAFLLELQNQVVDNANRTLGNKSVELMEKDLKQS